MSQGLIVAILSILFYLSNLLGGGMGQSVLPEHPSQVQQSYYVLGQTGQFLVDMTVRHTPQSEGSPVGTVGAKQFATILDKNEGWYKIRLSSGLEGWVPEYSLVISTPIQKDTDKVILAYFSDDQGVYETLLEHGSQLNSLSPVGWNLNSYGELQPNFDPEKLGRSLYFAGNQKLETYGQIVISANPSRLLTNTQLQDQSIQGMVKMLEEWGLTGILLDFRYVPSGEQEQLIQFIDQLTSTLKNQDLRILLALPWDENLNYAGLTSSVDYFVLKAETERATFEPGPLQNIHELTKIVESITKNVTPEKIILGVTTGGLDWPRSGLPTTVTHQEILELAATHGATIKWDSQGQAPYFHYGTGHVVWFENRYSLKYKVDLIKSYQLAGIALQNLGQEDPEIWSLLERNL